MVIIALLYSQPRFTVMPPNISNQVRCDGCPTNEHRHHNAGTYIMLPTVAAAAAAVAVAQVTQWLQEDT